VGLIFVLFWLLLAWGLRDNDIYLKEAAIFAVVWCAFLAGFIFVPQGAIWFIIGSVILDVILLMKVLGQDITVS
jgi:hypothetical protein